MIEFKRIEKSNMFTYSLILLWIFSVTLTYNILRGDHVSFTIGLGPFEVSFGFSVWRKLLP